MVGRQELGHRPYHTSTARAGTRRNCDVLRVIRVCPFALAVAAITRSFGPMEFPDFSKWARISA